jgi:hypothetical protein
MQHGYKPHHHDCYHHRLGAAYHCRHLQQVQMIVLTHEKRFRLAYGV